jgi:uncharacterized protein (TIGR03118 family)
MTRAFAFSSTRVPWLLTVSLLGLFGCEHHKRYLDAAFDPYLLTADRAGLAEATDPQLVNPVGLQVSEAGNLWVANNGSGTATLYGIDGTPAPAGAPTAVALPVSPTALPGSHAEATGIVYYGGSGFQIQTATKRDSARLLVATLDGTILGYNSDVDHDNAILALDNSATGAVYRGLAVTQRRGGAWLYATNFSAGSVDVFDEKFAPALATDLDPAAFEDQELPADYAPFGIQRIDGLLFVSYAERDADGKSPVIGAGNGFIDAFELDGRFAGRVTSQGDLDAPWGMTVSPWTFPYFGNALLVGNYGDGHINAFSLWDGSSLGVLRDSTRAPVAIDGLWDLTFGYGFDGSPALYFTAGPNGGANGSFGTLISSLVDANPPM